MKLMSKPIEEVYLTYDKKFTRVLIISDSHNHIKHAITMIERGQFDLVIHLGDIVGDIDDLKSIFPNINIVGVKGNCDFYEEGYPDLLILNINGVRIIACHGHQFRVKNSLILLEDYAKKIQADVALYGHSHKHNITYSNDKTFLNPGSISLPRGGSYPTFGVLEIERNGTIHSTLQEIKKKREKS